VIIRQARLEDLHWIYSLNKVIFHEDSWSYNSYKKCLEGDKYVFLVAEEKDPCGFVLGRVIKEEAEVMKIGVSPKFQRRHIGWLLFTKLLEEFKEWNPIHIGSSLKGDESCDYENIVVDPAFYAKEAFNTLQRIIYDDNAE
jgi:ribosomal protein S18 acetylase RimI-like enzyme